MTGMMAEVYVLKALQNGLLEIQQDPSKLDKILTALNSSEMESAQSFFADPKAISIAPGFPSNQSIFPFTGVTVADEDPLEEQTPIGMAYDRVQDDLGTWWDVMGARYNGAIKCTIYSPNADAIIWISAVVKWALLKSIGWFHTEDGGEMNHIRVRVADYEPAPQWLSTLTFARGVFLFAEYDSTFEVESTGIDSGTQIIQSPNFRWEDNS